MMGIRMKHMDGLALEPGRVRRSPLQGVERRPGLSASAEFDALLQSDSSLLPTLQGLL